MKKSRKSFLLFYWFLAFGAVLTLMVSLLTHAGKHAAYARASANNSQITALVVGLDEAAENTDVLTLATLREGSMFFMQIPRDTYVKTELYEGKINHLYRACTDKYGKKSGADEFLKVISEIFGVPIDYYAIFTGENLESLVDTLGGISLNVPHSFDYTDESGKSHTVLSGERRLNGRDALAYLRHRASYIEGDLGRLDAQMRFTAAFTRQLLEEKSLRTYLGIYQKNYRNLLTNLTEKDIIKLIQVYLANRHHFDVRFMRLPGEASQSEDGVWYYALNKKGAADMLQTFFGGNHADAFDEKKRFLRQKGAAFSNIYYAKNADVHIYTLDEAAKTRVLHK